MDPSEIIELHCAGAWRAVTEERLGDWRLRAASGFTGRANSALALGSPGMPVPRALDRVCDFAHVHGIPPVVQAVSGSETERAIEAAGWVPNTGHSAGHVVSVLVGPLGTGGDGVSFLPEPSPDWWELAAGTTEPTPAQRHVLTTGEVGYGMAKTTAGAVRAAIAGELLHISRLAVRPEHRRQGLARALMAAAGAWAAGRGATEGVLQVAVGNTPALSLYETLGFREHHRYRYWVPAWKDRTL
ncbi:GNAT family N-acetyltransferase [Amycolatopsis alkalitolerans]|uniref:GNAT family N-acetyltransferase n=1 Tax=Amycolatopsis alkalitolerans TaxID=2547244 RepID=A0A5C4LSG3_9PSEU|nr:GNAT family N-acetyltransferase [Amycolatopsis alkalitolerans]TNC20841.1 GNAT family N-acetyltransferase [Amycolatopsis alkalitolerans]